MISTLLAALVSLTITPNNCFEPCVLKAAIKLVEPEKVKQVCLHLVEGDFPRVSCWPPYGGKVNETQISNIPGGVYTVHASAVLAGGDIIATPKQTLTVIGNENWRIEDGY